MRRNFQIIILCIGFLLGVIFAANYQVDVWVVLFLIVIFVAIATLFYIKSPIGYVLFLVIGILVGIWRYDIFLHQQLPSALVYENQKVTVVGTVDGEPRWDEYRNYVFYINNGYINNRPVDGLVRVKSITGVAKEGQVVKASGKLKAGQGKAESYISYAEVEIVNTNQPAEIKIKSIFLRGLSNTLPPDSAAFMSGILIGARSALPKAYTDILTSLGLTHIVAVSGYNLTILVGFLNRRFAKNWRWGSLVGSLWIILGFVIISGASASILRAGIMSAIFLIVNYYGKKLNLLVCMSIAATTMIMAQPQSLLSDIGWQLSFLSLFGITVLSPKISYILPAKPKLLNDILSVTLAAQIATAGLVIYKFGQISVLAPMSNLIIMPIIPLLMLVGFISAVLGILLPNIAYNMFGVYIHNILSTIFDLLAYLSRLRFSTIEFINVPLRYVMAYYVIIIIFAILARRERKISPIDFNRDKINKEDNAKSKAVKGVQDVGA